MTLELLEDAIELLMGAITGVGTGIGAGANAFVTSLFINTGTSGSTLSAMAGTVFAFGGIALGIAFITRIFMWLTSIGN